MTKHNIFIFRRDLRIKDNVSLNYAMSNFENIIPIFIFTPEQISSKNKFKSDNAIQFMIESLKEVDSDLKKYNSKLHIFKGKNKTVLTKIFKELDIENVIFNMDYTPYAIKRDAEIAKLCKSKDINCIMHEDYLLAPIGSMLKSDGDPYTVFTPFKNNGYKVKIDKPCKMKAKNLAKTNKLNTVDYIKHKINDNILVRGGRKNGVKQLNKVKDQKKYNTNRNTLSIETSLLSAYIKFGCISIREVYWKVKDKLGTSNSLLSQLFWREFYFYIAYYFPQVLKGKNYNEKYDKIKWNKSKSKFEKWCNGETGYPVVDAGMREMNETGYMHNRARLITSNFLNRMLGMDWREGEKYFATMLTDYDPSVNNGNWQWIASTGTDPKPYFQRLFNPIIQSEKFDKQAEYIKKWIPELKDVPAKDIHKWESKHKDYDVKELGYFEPIVEYKKARAESVKMYREVL
jgi:deoxyribodipyrimidine photo-lyase